MEKPVLVVLAAGMGSRYGGLKQMDSVGSCGQCLVDYSLYDARRAGFETVIFVIKEELEADFREMVGQDGRCGGPDSRTGPGRPPVHSSHQR